MAAYAELVDLVQDPTFRKRILYAGWSVAVDILNDGASTAGQKSLARAFLKGSGDNDQITRLAIRCVSNPTIAAAGKAALDSDIRFVVAGTFVELVN